MRSHEPLRRALVALLLLAPPALSRSDATAWGTFEASVSLTPPTEFSAPILGPFPVDETRNLGDPLPPPAVSGLAAYATRAGFAKGRAATGLGRSWLTGTTRLFWERTFAKGGPGDSAQVTVPASWLAVAGDLPGTLGDTPYAQLDLQVTVWPESRTPAVPLVALEVHARIERGSGGGLELAYAESQRGGGAWSGCGPIAGLEGGVLSCLGHDPGHDAVPAKVIQVGEHELRLDLEGVVEALDLSAIGTGQLYTVRYYLHAEASNGVEAHAESVVGDPADAGAGISLQTVSVPADAASARLCELEPDPDHFVDALDGTVVDRYTGLTWQRCPVGFQLSTAGTAGLDDDHCSATVPGTLTWQEALQAGAADTFAGHDDWRVPDLKELTSLLSPACALPALEPHLFPDTPPAPFWSSTPGPGPDLSRTIEFGVGLMAPMARSAKAHARLVRGGQDPMAPLPALRLGRPRPVVEGDAGTTDLVFPVTLDRGAGTEVTVHYQTQDLSAVAGQDYEETAGTLSLPSGTTAAEIRVPVLGDVVGEPDEALSLTLSGPSTGVRLLQARQVGVIRDDEVRLAAWGTDALEGGPMLVPTTLFAVVLSRPAPGDVSVDWATADGTAQAGRDYVAGTGRITIPAGGRAALVSVSFIDDTQAEGDEELTLTLSNPSPGAVIEVATATGTIRDDDLPGMVGWNDTGVTTCADDRFFNLTCPVAGFPGQDAESGSNSFTLTKLDDAGAALPAGAASWSCVRDELTGLTWEVHPDDGGLRDRDWTYSWYRSDGREDGGVPGTPGGGSCLGGSGCDTEAYAAAVNDAGLCGYFDWRLPTWQELRSLSDLSRSVGTSHPAFFGDGPASAFEYWTATSVSSDATRALQIFDLASGTTLPVTKATPGLVRLVRAGP
jgi:hypothetical protein